MKSYQVKEFGAPLALAETPTPTPKGTEVLLKVRAAGVCHSDLHIWEGGYDIGHGKILSLKERGIALPMTMGHETAGEVVALGPSGTGVKPGDVCLVYPWIGCGTCAVCVAGTENLCMAPQFLGVQRPGGYADHIIVPHARYLLDLKGLDPVTAAPYACSGITTYSALRKIGPILDREPIVIIGAGGLGLMALALLKAMGGAGAIVVDIDEKKRKAALDAGALAVIDGKANDAAAQIMAAGGGPRPAAIDLVGSPQSTAIGFDCLAKGGKLIIVGLFGGAAPWSLPFIPMKAAIIQGSYVGNLSELRELLDLVRRKNIQPIPVTPCPLHHAQQALDDLHKGKVVGRTVLVP